MLNKDQVQKVAKLANLKLSDEEEEKYTSQLSDVLDFIDQLEELKTSEHPIFNVSGKADVKRDDVVGESLTQEEALSNASNTRDGFFVTKGVFEDE